MESAARRSASSARRRRGKALSVVFAAGLLTPFLGGCQQLYDLLGITDPWAGYRDSSYNFIGNLGFDKQDQTLAGYQSPALWTWAWRGAGDAGTFPYVTMDTPATDKGSVQSLGTVPSGLDPTAHAFLLELPNLLPAADSYFESGSPPDWSFDTGVTHSISSSSTILTGTKVLSASLSANGSSSTGMALNLTALTDRTSITSGSRYAYFLRLKSTDSSLHFIASLDGQGTPILAATTSLPTSNGGSALATSAYSTILPMTGGANEYKVTENTVLGNYDASQPSLLYFGTVDSNYQFNGSIDDVRALREDVAQNARLRLLLRLNDTNPSLSSGLWSFVVWVLVPAGGSFIDEAGAVPPIASSKVSLSMDGLIDNSHFSEVFNLDASTKTTWRRLELRMTNGNFDFRNATSSSQLAVELSVSPTDTGAPDIGGILIAQPELHFYLNGY